MKKSVKRSIIAISIMLVCMSLAIIMVGCDKVDKKLQSMQNSVSYYSDTMMVGEDNNFYVELVSGSRESALIADGEVGEMTAYSTLNVTPVGLDMTNRACTYKITGENGEIEGGLEKNILGISYNASISDLSKIGKVDKLFIMVGENTFEYTLTSIMEKGIDYKKAVESVYNNCSSDLEGMFDGKEFKCEIYTKISCDRSKDPKQYFWFVNIVENSDNMFCVLVDIQTGEIVAKKHR